MVLAPTRRSEGLVLFEACCDVENTQLQLVLAESRSCARGKLPSPERPWVLCEACP